MKSSFFSILIPSALFAFAGTTAHAQAQSLQNENIGIFRIVPGDPFVGGGSNGDGCTLEEAKASDRFEIKMSFGNSTLRISSDDQALRSKLQQPTAPISANDSATETSYPGSVQWLSLDKLVGSGSCTIGVFSSSMLVSNPTNSAVAKIAALGYRFEVMCQPKDRGVLQGQIFCRLRTRGR